jgi:hypothetical protein
VSRQRWRKLRVRPEVIRARLKSTKLALHMAFTCDRGKGRDQGCQMAYFKPNIPVWVNFGGYCI